MQGGHRTSPADCFDESIVRTARSRVANAKTGARFVRIITRTHARGHEMTRALRERDQCDVNVRDAVLLSYMFLLCSMQAMVGNNEMGG
jgi:hypothetical protein